MVDIHCHILPGVDDGAKSWEIALEMCRMAADDGIDHIVATPHANDEYEYGREHHALLLEDLRAKTGGLIRFTLGCDFHFSYDNIQDALAHPERYTIGDTRYLLVELSNFAIPPWVAEMLSNFVMSSVTPIITHPERNPILQRMPQTVLQWAELGCLVQVTGSSFTGRWGKKSKEVAEWLLKKNAIHVLASDAHGVQDRRPNLSEARDFVAKSRGHDIAERLVEENPRAIVEDEEISR